MQHSTCSTQSIKSNHLSASQPQVLSLPHKMKRCIKKKLYFCSASALRYAQKASKPAQRPSKQRRFFFSGSDDFGTYWYIVAYRSVCACMCCSSALPCYCYCCRSQYPLSTQTTRSCIIHPRPELQLLWACGQRQPLWPCSLLRPPSIIPLESQRVQQAAPQDTAASAQALLAFARL